MPISRYKEKRPSFDQQKELMLQELGTPTQEITATKLDETSRESIGSSFDTGGEAKPSSAPKDPNDILTAWLSIKDVATREEFWLQTRTNDHANSLPTVLLGYMYRLQYLTPDKSDSHTLPELERQFWNLSLITLNSQDVTREDLDSWAWILSDQDPETMIPRFITAQCKKPVFLLFEVLNIELARIQTLNKLLAYIWKQVQQEQKVLMASSTYSQPDASGIKSFMWPQHSILGPFSLIETRKYALQLLSLLLRHTLLLSPPVMVSVSRMIVPIMESALSRNCRKKSDLDGESAQELCHVLNFMLISLSRPAAATPYTSRAHNWEAQKVLLEWAGQFRPSLLLNKDGYHSVARVLAGLIKSDEEINVAIHRDRAWPPWRIHHDGMDAQRSPNADLSRPILALMRQFEAGYPEHAVDQALKITSGLETDGTPTIQTRTLFFQPSKTSSILPAPDDMNPALWIARVEATRDVQEAWSAFAKFRERGGDPGMAMYFAMFRKLEFDAARRGRKLQYQARFDAADYGGYGSGVIPPASDNYSEFYKTRLQPPSKDALYHQMITLQQVRPAGAFLYFLVIKARNPEQGLGYLIDCHVDPKFVDFLSGKSDIEPHDDIDFASLAPTLAAFITLLCRFAPRLSEDQSHERQILEWRNDNIPNCLLHAIFLLKQSRTRSRSSWYAVFRCLSLRRVVVDIRNADDPINDIQCWRMMVAGLNDFANLGLELDPNGFKILCNVLEKAVLASPAVEDPAAQFDKDSLDVILVKNEFASVSQCNDPEAVTAFYLPELLHPIDGVSLHAYVRVLGLVDDHEEIMAVLKWMLKHQQALDANASLRGGHSGYRMLHRVFVAMKIFIGETDYAREAEKLLGGCDLFGWEWPSDTAVQAYIEMAESYSTVHEEH